MLTEHFGQVNKKRARLLINDEIITGLKLQMTVEEMKLETGTLIYVEILSQENIWPTEQNKEADSRSKQETNKGLKSQHTIGLYNMGNTCYMNAALQCLANTKHFYEYFVQKRIYSVQINRDNAMGHKGSLVEAFAAIMH
jgi:ubiquitin carboxyl-terminal hydrolase 6/32